MLKNFLYYLGNFLVFLSIIVLLSIYLPIARLYLPIIQPTKATDQNFSITIPKINAQAPIIPDVDSQNPTEYKKALNNGVALAKGFSQPGENGTIYIFAHSYDSPWRMTSYNTAFFRLSELKNGDEIKLIKDGKDYRYLVFKKIEVWPNEMKFIYQNKSDNQLILQTCTPIGTSLKRLLVFAKPY